MVVMYIQYRRCLKLLVVVLFLMLFLVLWIKLQLFLAMAPTSPAGSKGVLNPTEVLVAVPANRVVNADLVGIRPVTASSLVDIPPRSDALRGLVVVRSLARANSLREW